MDSVSDTSSIQQEYQIPEVKNYSQAKRFAKSLFGPLVRVRPPRGVGEYEVYIEKNGEKLSSLGSGSTYTEALQKALSVVIAFEGTRGKLPRGVSPQMPVDTIKRGRHRLSLSQAVKPEHAQTLAKAIPKLKNNEVVAVEKLLSLSQDPEVPILAQLAAQSIGDLLNEAAARPEPRFASKKPPSTGTR